MSLWMPPHRTLLLNSWVDLNQFTVDQIGYDINPVKSNATRECFAVEIVHFLGRGGRRGPPSPRRIQHVHFTWETSNRQIGREYSLPPSENTAGRAQTPKRDPGCTPPPSPGTFGTEAVVPRSGRGHLRNQNNARDRAATRGNLEKRLSRGSRGPRG